VGLSRFYECLEVVVYVGVRSGANPVSSKELCDYQGVKPRHLEPFMQLLVKSGILKGTKGPKGGYTLAKEKRKITAGDIYNSVMPEFDLKGASSNNLRCDIILPLSDEINKSLMEKLNSITIEELCGKVSDTKTLKEDSKEFYI